MPGLAPNLFSMVEWKVRASPFGASTRHRRIDAASQTDSAPVSSRHLPGRRLTLHRRQAENRFEIRSPSLPSRNEGHDLSVNRQKS